MDENDLFALGNQNHDWWWPRNERSHAISSYGIDLVVLAYSSYSTRRVNTLRLRQNCCHFTDNIFKCILLKENAWISLNISLKFVPRVWIDNIPALVQIMAWRRLGDKPLSEPMMVCLLMHICVDGPQWIKMPSYNLIGIGNPTGEIKWSQDHLMSTIGFPIQEKWCPYIESGPCTKYLQH